MTKYANQQGVTSNSSAWITSSGGVPSWSQSLPSAVQVAVGSLNSGTGASSSTYWRGDGAWAATSGAGSLVPLATATASNSASLAFTSLFSSSYYQYLIKFTNILPASNAALYMVAGTGGTPTYVVAGYLWQGGGWYLGNNQSGTGSTSDSQAILYNLDSSTISNSSTYNGLSGEMSLAAIGGSSQTMSGTGYCSAYNAGESSWSVANFAFNLPAATYTALKFYMSTGNITSGTIDIYGVLAG